MSDLGAQDLVVVGGGIAGMVGALRAAQSGLKVLVLEKGTEDRYPCNSRFTAGLFHVCSRAVTLPPDELNSIIEAVTAGAARKDLQRSIADHVMAVIRWLQEQDVRFVRAGAHEARQWGLAPVNLPRAGLDWRGRAGDVMLDKLEKRLAELGGRVLRGARATRLLTENGRCLGVEAEVASQMVRLSAEAVLIADGGYQASPDLLARFVSSQPNALMQRCAPTGTGDGLRMCEAVGAQIDANPSFYGHLLGKEAIANTKLWPYPWFDDLAVVSIVVDASGRRFCDEGLGGTFVANQVARLKDASSAVLIFDEKIWENQGRAAVVPPNDLFEKHGGTMVRANSVATLAERLGLPAEALRESLRTHNESVRSGLDVPGAPQRTRAKFQPVEIDEGELIAVRLVAGVTYAMGGVVIDGGSRVLDKSGQPIPGLFAAGAATGGLEGGGAAGYVGGLVKSSVTGFLAAESVVTAHRVPA